MPSFPRPDRLAAVGLLLSLGLYTASFFLPAFEFFFDTTERLTGWDAFMAFPRHLFAFSAESPKSYPEQFMSHLFYLFSARGDLEASLAWLANPLLWVGLLCLLARHWRAAYLAGILGLLAGLSLFRIWYLDQTGELHLTFFVGYYLWLASLAVVTGVGAWKAWLQPRRAAAAAVSGVGQRRGCSPQFAGASTEKRLS